MNQRRLMSIVIGGVAIVGIGCDGGASVASVAYDQPDRIQSPLRDSNGNELGNIKVNAIAGPGLTAEIVIHLEGATPNTTYALSRSGDAFRALNDDGICQRALGLSPWGPSDPPAPQWVPFPNTLTTDDTGGGKVDFTFSTPNPAFDGYTYDIEFRVTGPEGNLLSDCMTYTDI
jgi:hypothetical protein